MNVYEALEWDACAALRLDMRLSAERFGAKHWRRFVWLATKCIDIPCAIGGPVYREILAVEALLQFIGRLRIR